MAHMEVMQYVRLFARHWFVFAIGAIGTTVVGAVLLVPRPDVYQATGTYVVRPTSAEASDVVRAFDTLIRGVEINATYAAIARSDIIQDRAEAQLASGPPIDTRNLTVDAEVVTGTNIIRISVRGEDPEAATIFAEKIGSETVSYVSGLGDAFRVEQLDPPTVPRRPVGPNHELDLAITVVLGLGIGAMLAVVREAVTRRSTTEHPPLNVIDPVTGLFNEAFFKLRLEQEIARTKGTDQPLGVAMIRLAGDDPWESRRPVTDPKALKVAAGAISKETRASGIVSYLGDGVLAAVLAGSDLAEASDFAVSWAARMSVHLNWEGTLAISVGSGACEHKEDRFAGDEQVRELVVGLLGQQEDSRPEAAPALST